MNNLAVLYYQSGRYAEAESEWQEALPVYREVYGPEHPEVATLLNNLGRSALMAGRVAESIPLLEQAVQMSEKLQGPTHDELVPPLNSLGMAYLYEGDNAHARANIDRALQIARLRDHVFLDQVLLNAADLELSLRRTDGAPALLDEARRLLQDTLSAFHGSDGAMALCGMGFGQCQSAGFGGEARSSPGRASPRP